MGSEAAGSPLPQPPQFPGGGPAVNPPGGLAFTFSCHGRLAAALEMPCLNEEAMASYLAEPATG